MTVVSNEMHVSLWLLPPPSIREELRQNIADLAKKYGGPPFEPHVTIVGAWSKCRTYDEATNLAGLMSTGLRDIKGRVPCRFGGEAVSASDSNDKIVWSQACVSVMERSEEFMSLVKRTREVLGIDKDDDDSRERRWDFPPPLKEPHLSHFYGEQAVPDSQEVVVPPDFVAEEIGIWDTSGGLAGVRHWKELARIKLGEKDCLPNKGIP